MTNSERRLVAPIVLLVAFFVAGLVAQPIVADAATEHRAAVIVDTGASVHRVVITFTEDSITGIDALQRANADPVVYTFNSQGGAVCRLFGVGRDAGPNCLGGQDGDSRYWAYFKAPAGASSFTYSPVGAGQAKVHDGDVEGWKFGTGAAPEFVSLQSLTPPPGPVPTNPPAQDPVTPRGAAGAGPAARGNPALADAAASASALPATGATGSPGAAAGPAGASGNASAAGSHERRADAKHIVKNRDTTQAALASSSKDGNSSAASLIWFGALLAVIVIAIVVARRIRRRPQRST